MAWVFSKLVQSVGLTSSVVLLDTNRYTIYLIFSLTQPRPTRKKSRSTMDKSATPSQLLVIHNSPIQRTDNQTGPPQLPTAAVPTARTKHFPLVVPKPSSRSQPRMATSSSAFQTRPQMRGSPVAVTERESRKRSDHSRRGSVSDRV